MSKTKKSRLPIGVKEVGSQEDIAKVVKQLKKVEWLKDVPQHPNCPTYPFPYGTSEPIFK